MQECTSGDSKPLWKDPVMLTILIKELGKAWDHSGDFRYLEMQDETSYIQKDQAFLGVRNHSVQERWEWGGVTNGEQDMDDAVWWHNLNPRDISNNIRSSIRSHCSPCSLLSSEYPCIVGHVEIWPWASQVLVYPLPHTAIHVKGETSERVAVTNGRRLWQCAEVSLMMIVWKYPELIRDLTSRPILPRHVKDCLSLSETSRLVLWRLYCPSPKAIDSSRGS